VHQPVHSPNTDVYAIVTLKDMLDFVSPQTLVIIRIDMEDCPFNMLVFRNTGSGLGMEMLIIGAPVDI
jgi:hypothetical protein